MNLKNQNLKLKLHFAIFCKNQFFILILRVCIYIRNCLQAALHVLTLQRQGFFATHF